MKSGQCLAGRVLPLRSQTPGLSDHPQRAKSNFSGGVSWQIDGAPRGIPEHTHWQLGAGKSGDGTRRPQSGLGPGLFCLLAQNRMFPQPGTRLINVLDRLRDGGELKQAP
jgi:hypothetical protein